MSSWLSLTKKELRLGFPVFLLPIAFFFIIAGIGAYFGKRSEFTWEAVAVISFLAILGLVFYLPYYLLYSLSSERKKLHLWLHNPLPGYSLLLAKIVAGLLSMVVSLLIFASSLLTALNLSKQIHEPLPWGRIIEIAFLGGTHLFLFTISFGVWFLFFWIIFLLCTRFSGTFLSFVITAALFIATISLYGWFGTTSVYELLTGWGELHPMEIIQGLQFSSDWATGVSDVTTEVGQFTVYLGVYILEAIVTFLLFGAAAWLLDNKVEV